MFFDKNVTIFNSDLTAYGKSFDILDIMLIDGSLKVNSDDEINIWGKIKGMGRVELQGKYGNFNSSDKVELTEEELLD